tara:strand:- start:116 stop:322 length:207 start_codon:yes stop_codon:yes gene_type:complete
MENSQNSTNGSGLIKDAWFRGVHYRYGICDIKRKSELGNRNKNKQAEAVMPMAKEQIPGPSVFLESAE